MTQQANCKERLNAQAPAQKKAHSKLYSICVVILCLVCRFSYGDITNDVAQLKADISSLKSYLSTKTCQYYDWTTDSTKSIAGSQYAIATTLRYFAKGVHDDILPKIGNIADNTANLSNLTAIAEILLRVADMQEIVADRVDSIMYAVFSLQYSMDYLTTYVYDIYQDVGDTKLYVYDILQEVQTLRLDFQNYKDLALSYLQSLDNNVGVIAEIQERNSGYIQDIYNSISAGINVNLATGFPEIPDYTSILESIRDPFFTGWVSGFTPVNSYIAGGVVWSNSHTLDRNTSNLSDVNATGNFFTDVLQILSQDNRLLSSVNKSLMLLCGTNDNTSAEAEVSEMESSVTDLEAQRDSALSAYEPWRNLQFQDVHEHLDASHFSNLKGMGSFPGYISFEVPAYRKGVSSSFIEINLNKVRGFIDFLRNLVTWVYWGLTIYLVWFVFKIFLKMVDKVTSIFNGGYYHGGK